jgi:serine phosphatase RsbU (regulator of sigma subunit)
MHVEPALPFGLDASFAQIDEIELGTEALEPGDIVVLNTDGVVEARSPQGNFFGIPGLVDLLIRNLASGLPAPETMRRIIRARSSSISRRN